MSGGSSPKTPPSQTTTTTKTVLPTFQKRALQEIFGKSRDAFFGPKAPEAFPEALLADLSSQTRQGLSGMTGAAENKLRQLQQARELSGQLGGANLSEIRARTIDPGTIRTPSADNLINVISQGQARHGLRGLSFASGIESDLQRLVGTPISPDARNRSQLEKSLLQGLQPGGTSPETLAAIEDAQGLINRNLTENVFSAIEDQAIAAGGLGGDRQGVAQGIAARGAIEESSRVANRLLLADLDRQQRERFQSQAGISSLLGQDIQSQIAGNQLSQSALQQLQGLAGLEADREQAAISNLFGIGGNQLQAELANQQARLNAAINTQNFSQRAQQLNQQAGLQENQTRNAALLNRINILSQLSGAEGLLPESLIRQGEFLDDRAQRELQARADLFTRQQQQPVQNLLNAASIANMNVGQNTTQLATNPAAFSNTPERNRLTGALGGAASGAAIGSTFAPGIGTAIGAVGGGLIGAFA